MSGVRRGARSVLKWFSPLYVVLIIVQVFLAGEGVFRLRNVYDSDTCKQAASHCGGSTTLEPHRILGFILTEPLALLFLIVALLAWHSNTRVRIVTIAAPILTFVQLTQMGWRPSRAQRDPDPGHVRLAHIHAPPQAIHTL